VGFFADGQLKRIAVTGGAPLVVCDAGGVGGAAWSGDGTIVFAPTINSGLMRVSADGGIPEVLTTPDRTQGEVSHRWPQFLPGDDAVLYTAMDGGFGWEGSHIAALRLDTGERRILVRGGHTGRYVPSGHLVYSQAGNALAVPFDPVRLETRSDTPVAVVEGILETGAAIGAGYSPSEVGSFAYVPGEVYPPESRLVWIDRDGNTEPLAAPVRRYLTPALSPGGQQVAVSVVSNRDEIWIYELNRGTLSLLTPEGSSLYPLWTPDGRRVAYRAGREGRRNIYWRAADGTGPEEPLTTGENMQTPESWSPDGNVLLYREQHPITGSDAWMITVDGDRATPVLNTSANEGIRGLSPDGRWLAFQSDESGRLEVYVQAFTEPGRRIQVSIDGGAFPEWNRNGRELLYVAAGTMMSVAFAPGPTFAPNRPRELFDIPASVLRAFSGFRLPVLSAPDGQRFLAILPVEPERPATQINIILNWDHELKRLVPTG
jgi:serine/threonine-protein kinase